MQTAVGSRSQSSRLTATRSPFPRARRNQSRLYTVVAPRIREGGDTLGILWIILIIVLVLALLGFFGRGYW